MTDMRRVELKLKWMTRATLVFLYVLSGAMVLFISPAFARSDEADGRMQAVRAADIAQSSLLQTYVPYVGAIYAEGAHGTVQGQGKERWASASLWTIYPRGDDEAPVWLALTARHVWDGLKKRSNQLHVTFPHMDGQPSFQVIEPLIVGQGHRPRFDFAYLLLDTKEWRGVSAPRHG